MGFRLGRMDVVMACLEYLSLSANNVVGLKTGLELVVQPRRSAMRSVKHGRRDSEEYASRVQHMM